MALQKVTYIDLVTIIGAQNLNDIQDAIIALEEWQSEAGADIPQILANIAPSFSNSTSYSAGDCVIVLNKLYQFTAAHPAGNWTGADATEVNVTSLLKEAVASLSGNMDSLSDEVDDLKSAIGDLPFVDVASESSMTDTSKIYRFDGALWFYDGAEWTQVGTGFGGGGAVVVTKAEDMIDHSLIYLYEGTETGYTAGHFYYYNGSAWIDGGLYYVGKDGKNGTDGVNGRDGQDGFSPIATVEATSTGARISITDKTGTTSATVQNGTATDAQVAAWLDEHPEATTTVEDGSISKVKLAADVLDPVSEIPYIEKTIGENFVAAQQAFSNVTWNSGYFNPTTGATAGNSQYRYTDEYFDIGILAAVKSAYLNTRNIACVVFYDASKEVVGTINQTTNGGLIVTSITPPNNAVYFRICQPTANTDPFPLSLYVVGDLFAKAETDLPVDIQSVLTAQGGILVDGSLSTYADWKVTDFIKVSPGMLLKYSGCGNIGGNATLCPVAFYDSDKKLVLAIKPTESNFVYMYNKGWLDASATGTSINFGFVLVPPSAHYCRISGYRLLQPTLEVATVEAWAGKKCVFFGDSITYGVGTVEKYCNFLAMLRGITVANYAVNGSVLVDNGMSRVTAFATDYADNPADTFIFAYGTNDWGGGKPLGEWYTTDDNGVRTLSTDTTTFRGAWVQILTYLKTNFDSKKIILMTPIHRGAGSYASDLTRNNIGLYLEDYVKVIKEAGEIFSVDVIDLYGESGLNPNINPSTIYFTPNDRLHPNVEGHKQMAKVISAKMGNIEI